MLEESVIIGCQRPWGISMSYKYALQTCMGVGLLPPWNSFCLPVYAANQWISTSIALKVLRRDSRGTGSKHSQMLRLLHELLNPRSLRQGSRSPPIARAKVPVAWAEFPPHIHRLWSQMHEIGSQLHGSWVSNARSGASKAWGLTVEFLPVDILLLC